MKPIRLAFNLALLFVACTSMAQADTFAGVISKVNTNVYLLPSAGVSGSLEVKTLTSDVQKNLLRLESGDYMEASGSLVGNALVLNSIDFVALAALLGTWKNGDHWIIFRDFSNALVSLQGTVDSSERPVAMPYSIIPGVNNTWKIFFSSVNRVISASLSLKGDTAEFSFVDPNSGNPQVYQLVKLSFSDDQHKNGH